MKEVILNRCYLIFFVSFTEGGLEARVCVHEAWDFFDCVDDEHIHEVLAGSVQPVSKRIKWVSDFFACVIRLFCGDSENGLVTDGERIQCASLEAPSFHEVSESL